MVTKVCKQCWFEFEARRSTAKFCSAACRQKNHRSNNTVSSTAAAYHRTIDERLTCPHCGKGYWKSIKGRPAKYCSNSCRSSANRIKKAAAFRLFQEKLGYTYGGAYMAIGKGDLSKADSIAAMHGYHYSLLQRQYIKTVAWFSLDPEQLGIQW